MLKVYRTKTEAEKAIDDLPGEDNWIYWAYPAKKLGIAKSGYVIQFKPPGLIKEIEKMLA